jgi:hypothetical protein
MVTTLYYAIDTRFIPCGSATPVDDLSCVDGYGWRRKSVMVFVGSDCHSGALVLVLRVLASTTKISLKRRSRIRSVHLESGSVLAM